MGAGAQEPSWFVIFIQSCGTCSNVFPQVLRLPDRRICSNTDLGPAEQHRRYSDPCGTNNAYFSILTRFPIPTHAEIPPIYPPTLAFSADGFKFAMAMGCRVSVCDIRSKVPLKTFMEVNYRRFVQNLQFSSGTLGKEILAFLKVPLIFTF